MLADETVQILRGVFAPEEVYRARSQPISTSVQTELRVGLVCHKGPAPDREASETVNAGWSHGNGQGQNRMPIISQSPAAYEHTMIV